MRRSSVISPLILLVLATADPAAAQEAERFSVSGDAVAVYNIAGSVRIEAGTGSNVVVELRRGGRDAAGLNVQRATVDGRSALVVRYPAGDIVYRSGEWRGQTTMHVRDDGTFFGNGDRGDRITIRGSGSGTEAHADLRVLVPAGKSVFLKLGVGAVTANNVNGALDIDVASAGVSTSGTRGNLNIDTGSGRVTVRDATGNVNIDTGSGSVVIDNVNGDELLIDTGSGAVRGNGITASTVNVDTGSGSIELMSVAARSVELDTGSGSVTLDLTTDIDLLRIDTGSGSIRLTVPENLGANIDVDTSSGRVTTDLPITVRRQERDRLQGRIGDGNGSIEIDTGSGSVRIMRR